MRGERNTEDAKRISTNAQKKREAHTGESYGDRVSAARRRCFLKDQTSQRRDVVIWSVTEEGGTEDNGSCAK